MIKLIVSDLDGCLLDAKEIHFDAFNLALKTVDSKYCISLEEHLKTYDGLSTREKLKILHKEKGLPERHFSNLSNLKQLFTIELLEKFDNYNKNLRSEIEAIKKDGYLFYVASNAVEETVIKALKILNIFDLIDGVYSNKDVVNIKPHPEIYLQCMLDAGVSPSETLIIEDSKKGLEAATRSGSFVYAVDTSFDFNYKKIKEFINKCSDFKFKWPGKSNLNILIPMAGAGSRFAQAGYRLPKPLIPVRNKTMIQLVVENLNIDANYIFIVQEEHDFKYNLKNYLSLLVPGCKIITTNGLTEGAACTTLLAKEYIDNDNHLLIANSDQFVEWDSADFLYNMISNNLDGGILTFNATESKWSYAKIDENNYVVEVAEKKPISTTATAGIYYFKKGSDYVKYAEQMINKNIRTNNEFYVCPVFNEGILEGKRIVAYPVRKMMGLGTPEDLNYFLENYK